MKTSTILLLVLFLDFVQNISSEKSLAAFAISQLIHDNFLKVSHKIDVINFGQKQGKSEKLIDEFLSFKSELTVVQVLKRGNENSWNNKLNSSSILLFDSSENFEEFRDNITWQSNNVTRYQHLVCAPKLNFIAWDIKDKFSLDNVNFLETENQRDSIDLITSFMFTRKFCFVNQFEIVNSFNKTTKKWNKTTFYHEKYRNFHGCPLRSERKLKPIWLVSLYFDAFTRALNFDADKNQSENVVDFDIKQHDSAKTHVFGRLTHYDETKVFIPPGELYTPLEKMFLPFDFHVWIGIFATLSIGLVAIQIVNRFPLNVRNSVYGEGVTSPSDNLLSTFLAGSQQKIPARNFGRIILMLFIIWSLIIRTCYQSVLYKILQHDLRKPELKSLKELIENNFTFYELNKGNSSFIRGLAIEKGLGK